MATFEPEAEGAYHAKTRRKTSQEEGTSYTKILKKERVSPLAQNHHHSKAAVMGVLESKCSAVEEVSRSQVRNGFMNHGRETANFHLRKTGQH